MIFARPMQNRFPFPLPMLVSKVLDVDSEIGRRSQCQKRAHAVAAALHGCMPGLILCYDG